MGNAEHTTIQIRESNYDFEKVDEMVLALLHLTTFSGGKGLVVRAWKGLDWDALNRLHDKGADFRSCGKS